MSNNTLTIREVATLLGVHQNTIRNYIRRGKLPAEKNILEGKETWVIKEDELYHCGIPQVLNKLGPQDVLTRYDKVSLQPYVTPEKWLEEITRLSRENGELFRQIAEVTAEYEIVKYQAEKLLPATTAERDQLRERVEEVGGERDELKVNAEVISRELEIIKASLEEARANARWGYRRRLKKAVGE